MKWISLICIFAGLGVLIWVFAPVAQTEVSYQVYRRNVIQTIDPIDNQLGIVIPDIGANAHIIAHVDPYDRTTYQQALTQGVAHAQGTVLPGDQGTSFLFSHSSADWLTASRYNSVFYLLSKLETGDPIDIYRNGHRITFKVTEKQIVKPTALSFLTDQTAQPRLVLMTCWPPGTDFNRLLVIAELDPNRE